MFNHFPFRNLQNAYDTIYSDLTWDNFEIALKNAHAIISDFYYSNRYRLSKAAEEFNDVAPTKIARLVHGSTLPFHFSTFDAVAKAEDVKKAWKLSGRKNAKYLLYASGVASSKLLVETFIRDPAKNFYAPINLLASLLNLSGTITILPDFVQRTVDNVMLSSVIYKSTAKVYPKVEEEPCEHGAFSQIKAILADIMYYVGDLALIAAIGIFLGEYPALITSALVYGRAFSMLNKGQLCTEDRHKKLAKENFENYSFGSLLFLIVALAYSPFVAVGLESFFIRDAIFNFVYHLFIPAAAHKRMPSSADKSDGVDLFKYSRFMTYKTADISSQIIGVIVKRESNWRSQVRKILDDELFNPILLKVDPYLKPIQKKFFSGPPNPEITKFVQQSKKGLNAIINFIAWFISINKDLLLWIHQTSKILIENTYQHLPLRVRINLDEFHNKLKGWSKEISEVADQTRRLLLQTGKEKLLGPNLLSYQAFVQSDVGYYYLKWNANTFRNIAEWIKWIRESYISYPVIGVKYITDSTVLKLILSDFAGKIITGMFDLLEEREKYLKTIAGKQVMIHEKVLLTLLPKRLEILSPNDEYVQRESGAALKIFDRLIKQIKQDPDFKKHLDDAIKRVDNYDAKKEKESEMEAERKIDLFVPIKKETVEASKIKGDLIVINAEEEEKRKQKEENKKQEEEYKKTLEVVGPIDYKKIDSASIQDGVVKISLSSEKKGDVVPTTFFGEKKNLDDGIDENYFKSEDKKEESVKPAIVKFTDAPSKSSQVNTNFNLFNIAIHEDYFKPQEVQKRIRQRNGSN